MTRQINAIKFWTIDQFFFLQVENFRQALYHEVRLAAQFHLQPFSVHWSSCSEETDWQHTLALYVSFRPRTCSPTSSLRRLWSWMRCSGSVNSPCKATDGIITTDSKSEHGMQWRHSRWQGFVRLTTFGLWWFQNEAFSVTDMSLLQAPLDIPIPDPPSPEDEVRTQQLDSLQLAITFPKLSLIILYSLLLTGYGDGQEWWRWEEEKG